VSYVADDIVRPVIRTISKGYYQISGLDASTSAGERLARDFVEAPSPEDIVGVVYEAIEAGVRMFAYTGQQWIQFSPAAVEYVACSPW